MDNQEKFWTAIRVLKSDVKCTVNGDIETEEDFNNIISLINKHKIINECYLKAQHYINLASNSLSVFRDTKEKEILKKLTSFSLARNF